MSWKILIERGNLEFSAAHFITFEGQCEPLHGHNYGVRVEAAGDLSQDSYVLNFIALKNITRSLAKDWDHRFLLPLHNPHLHLTEQADAWEITYAPTAAPTSAFSTAEPVAPTRYVMPKSAVVPLAIDNATAERLAELLAHRILQRLRTEGLAETLDRLTVGIEETQMQTAFYTLAVHAGQSPGR